MKYPVIEDILPRLESNKPESLNNLSNLIDEALDFGTNLLKWELEKGQKGDEHIVPILFFRNILSVADGISILIKNSSIDNSKSLVRVLIESIFSLEYLLQENTKNRALAYFVWNAHKDLKFIEQINSQTESGKQLKANISKDKFTYDIELEYRPEFDEGKKNAEELLKLSDYLPIEIEYQRTHLLKKNPNWFTLYDGPIDFEKLSAKINLNSIYQIHYRYYSKNIHTTNVHKGVLLRNEDGSGSIIQIRSWKDSISTSVDTLNFLLVSFMTFQRKLLPERNGDFKKWYGEFRNEYLQLVEISHKNSEKKASS
jgi:hypothetical protein